MSNIFARLNAKAGLEEYHENPVEDIVENGSEVELKLSDVEDEQVGVIDGEIAEIEEEAAEVDRDTDELVEKAEEVELVKEAVEAFNDEGGMHPQAARLLHNQLAASFEALGLESYSLAAEAFEGTATREMNTVAALESIGDAAKKTWELIKQMFARLRQLLADLWAKLSLKNKRVIAKAKKIEELAKKVKTANAEVKVGANPALYKDGKLVANDGIGKLLDAFVVDFTKHFSNVSKLSVAIDTDPAETVKRTTWGSSAATGPFNGEGTQYLAASLPGDKGLFVFVPKVDDKDKLLAGIKVATGSTKKGETSAVEKVAAAAPSAIASRVASIRASVEKFEAVGKDITKSIKDIKEAGKTSEKSMGKEAGKSLRDGANLVRKLTSAPTGLTSAFLGAVSANLAFAARELSAVSKASKASEKKAGKK